MSINTTLNPTSSIDQDLRYLNDSYRENIASPEMNIAMAENLARLSNTVSFKTQCVMGMIKLMASCCKDIVRIVGT